MYESRRIKPRTIAITGVGGGTIAAHIAAAVFFASHDPYHSTIFPPCPILAFTGFQCPGCGGTRSVYSLFHGDLAASLAMNPLVLASYAAGLLLVASIVATRLQRPLFSAWLSGSAIAVVGIAAVYVTVIRNLIPG